MTRVAIYARYSSDRQNERSIADQVMLAQRHAAAKAWEIVAVHSDAAISGGAMANRPGLNTLLAEADHGAFDVVLVEDTDRLARNREHDAKVYNRLADAGVYIATFTTDKVTVIESALKGLMNELYVVQLSEKTKRGVRSNAEKGLATGSRLYGYRSQPGGAVEIVEGEAEVIRRIFAAYAGGETGREIASALNAEGVPGPRGGLWNNNTIIGSRQRGNGVLNTELYVGVKVWGRMDVRKDRETGKRKPRMLPQEAWKRTPVPHLRIVDDATWRAVRARKGLSSAAPQTAQRRPGLFSGLLKCGCCGGTYTVYTTGKLICATYREKGTCSNRRTPKRSAVEALVLAALREQMLSPEAVASYVRAYRHAAQARKLDVAAREAPLKRRLAEVERAIQRGNDAIMRGVSNAAMEGRLVEMEAERRALVDQLAEAAEPPAAVELHPQAARAYAEMVAVLQETLSDLAKGETQAERQLIDAVRGLIDRILITPLTQERGGPIDVVIQGSLAGLLGEQGANARLGAVVAGASYRLTQPSVPMEFRRRL